jgi:hypothetical protein
VPRETSLSLEDVFSGGAMVNAMNSIVHKNLSKGSSVRMMHCGSDAEASVSSHSRRRRQTSTSKYLDSDISSDQLLQLNQRLVNDLSDGEENDLIPGNESRAQPTKLGLSKNDRKFRRSCDKIEKKTSTTEKRNRKRSQKAKSVGSNDGNTLDKMQETKTRDDSPYSQDTPKTLNAVAKRPTILKRPSFGDKSLGDNVQPEASDQAAVALQPVSSDECSRGSSTIESRSVSSEISSVLQFDHSLTNNLYRAKQKVCGLYTVGNLDGSISTGSIAELVMDSDISETQACNSLEMGAADNNASKSDPPECAAESSSPSTGGGDTEQSNPNNQVASSEQSLTDLVEPVSKGTLDALTESASSFGFLPFTVTNEDDLDCECERTSEVFSNRDDNDALSFTDFNPLDFPDDDEEYQPLFSSPLGLEPPRGEENQQPPCREEKQEPSCREEKQEPPPFSATFDLDCPDVEEKPRGARSCAKKNYQRKTQTSKEYNVTNELFSKSMPGNVNLHLVNTNDASSTAFERPRRRGKVKKCTQKPINIEEPFLFVSQRNIYDSEEESACLTANTEGPSWQGESFDFGQVNNFVTPRHATAYDSDADHSEIKAPKHSQLLGGFQLGSLHQIGKFFSRSTRSVAVDNDGAESDTGSICSSSSRRSTC